MDTFPYPVCDSEVVLIKNKRYFGEFKCCGCARWWKSGNSWLGFGQNCTGCGNLTFPWKLSYLQLPSTSKDEKEKEHPQEDCERCRKLGYYCRKSDGVEIQHIISGTNQTASSTSVWPEVYYPESSNRTNSSRYFNSESAQVDVNLRQRTHQTESPPEPQARSFSASSSNYDTGYEPLDGNFVNFTASSTVESNRTNAIAFNYNSSHYNRSNESSHSIWIYLFVFLLGISELAIIAIFGYGIYFCFRYVLFDF